jgi:hypothetical protein
VSSPYQITAGDVLYTVVNDCTTSYLALVTGTVTDEIFGELFAPDLTVETGRADLASKTTANGLFAITGYPDQSFPDHGGTSYPLFSFKIKAPGFREQTVKLPIMAGVPFPVVPLSAVALRRLPVRIQGRVVNDLTRAPIAGALVVSVDNPMTPPAIHTTAMRAPLYFDHASGKAAQLVTVAPTGTANLQIRAGAGTQVINLDNRSGLAANSIVQLSPNSNLVIEYGVVDHLGPGPAASPGDVFLRNALNRSYPASPASTVQFVNATPTGGVANLSNDANAGDGVLLANQVLNGTTLVVEAGTPIAEYHQMGALSDSDGYYSLDGMGRVQEIFLHSSSGPLQETVGWFIEYEHATNVVDLRLS